MNTIFSIKIKFLCVFLIISIIPEIIVALISYNSYTTIVNNQVSTVASNTISNSAERMENVFKDISRITETFIFQQSSSTTYISEELKKLTQNQDMNQYDQFQTWKYMSFVCRNLLYNYSYINGVYIFTPSGYNISFSNSTDLKLEYMPTKDEWYEKTVQLKGELYLSEVETKNFIINSTKSISFSRALYDPNSHDFLGVLMLDCNLDIFKGLDKDIIPNISSMYLVNENGKILFDDTKNKISQLLPKDISDKITAAPQGSFKTENRNILVVFKTLNKNNWKVVALMSTDALAKQFGATRNLIIYISVICAIVFILLSIILSTLLTKPITDLSEIMRKNKSHKLVTTKKHLERSDEIGILYTEYNNMINDINTFIKENYQSRLISLDSQMKALEAQINSHFLYNTLASIHSIAEIEEVPSISIMSKALGDLFRYSIKTKSELVSVEQELAHVNNYVSIQKICYDDKINFILEIEEDLFSTRILKLIIQPIVENAIYHGLEKKKGKGNITIKGYCAEDKVYFEIIDDGIGISSDQMDEITKLLNEPPKFTELGQRNERSIGIKNVHSRIELYYGKGYGLTFTSIAGFGTKVIICVPRIP